MPPKETSVTKTHPNEFLDGNGKKMYKYEFGEGQDKELIITPKPIEEMTQEDFTRNLKIIDPTPGRLPQNLTVTFKDPQWAGHWFNKKAGDARRIGIARSLGFVPAKREDLEHYFAGLNDKDGALEDHDVILMKIHKAKLYKYIAESQKSAQLRGSINGYRDAAEAGLGEHSEEQISYYHTPQALKEFQGLGRVPKSRDEIIPA